MIPYGCAQWLILLTVPYLLNPLPPGAGRLCPSLMLQAALPYLLSQRVPRACPASCSAVNILVLVSLSASAKKREAQRFCSFSAVFEQTAEPQCFYLQYGNNKSTSFVRLLRGGNESNTCNILIYKHMLVSNPCSMMSNTKYAYAL